MDKRFSRTALLFGDMAVKRLEQSRVAVFGLGGVGAYAVEALARSGIGFLRIVDFDTIKLSNCNRQLLALEDTVSCLKVDIQAERIGKINPLCVVDKRAIFIDEQTVGPMLDSIEYVIDAIDSVSSKVSLLAHAHSRGIPTVTCMGAANRTDPSLLRTGDISESRICPLAKIIRKRIHRRGIYEGIRCIYSIEPAEVVHGTELDSEESFIRGRERAPLGSVSYMTGIVGLMAAREIIHAIVNCGWGEDTTAEIRTQDKIDEMSYL